MMMLLLLLLLLMMMMIMRNPVHSLPLKTVAARCERVNTSSKSVSSGGE
jgi:hypothetical protein